MLTKTIRHILAVTALFFILVLTLTGCSLAADGIRGSLQNAASKVLSFGNGVAQTLSVRALQDSNAELEEDETVTWTVTRLYYDSLSEKEQLAYRCIYNHVFAHPERISIPLLSDEEFSAVFAALRYDNPHLLCLSGSATMLTAGIKCYFVPKYAHTYWDCRAACKACLEEAQTILSVIPADADAYTKMLSAHDILCSLCSYREDSDRSGDIYGALVEKKAVCAGYAKALKLLLDMQGIPSCAVTGTVPSETDGALVSHMWLAVQLNGTWGHCDITWDDPVSDSGLQTIDHAYFFVGDSAIARNHTDIVMPANIVCPDTGSLYFLREGLYCEYNYTEEFVLNCLLTALANGRTSAEMQFANSDLLQQAKDDLITDGQIYPLLRQAKERYENLSGNRVSFSSSDDMQILKLIFVYE